MKKEIFGALVEINLKQLEKDDLHLQGVLPAEELDIPHDDECIELQEQVHYNLHASLQGHFVLIRGLVRFVLDCECVRCLNLFRMPVELNFNELLALEGEESVEIKDDSIDLTHYIREDILLAYPQHPLCDEDCDRLPQMPSRKGNKRSAHVESKNSSSTWAELDNLKLD